MTLMVERLGSTACRPRFATPRNEDFPTFGQEVGEVARRLGRPLMEWQQALVDTAYEYDPDSGLFRYTEVDTTVPRQSGKTTVTLAKKVHRLTVMARRLGPQRSTYTAQTRLAARKKLERDFAELLRGSRSFREVTNAKARPSRATEWRLSLNNGSEAIQFGAGSFLQIDAPSRTGGHGDTLDDGDIDEAFTHEDDTVEASMRPAMATRRNAQLWVTSTAGDERSRYLYRKVLAGRAATESGEHGKVCYVEYSAHEDEDPGDPRTWWGCMPALGVTITEEFIRGEWERAQRKGQEGIDTFRRAYLNQWPNVPVLEEGSGTAIDMARWAKLVGPKRIRGRSNVFGVDVAEDRTAAFAVAYRVGDNVRVESAGEPVGAHRLVERCKELVASHGGRVAVPTSLVEELKRANVPVIEVKSSVWPVASVALVDRIVAGTIEHGNQSELTEAVKALRWGRTSMKAERAFQLRDSVGAGPAFALVRALHGVLSQPVSHLQGPVVFDAASDEIDVMSLQF